MHYVVINWLFSFAFCILLLFALYWHYLIILNYFVIMLLLYDSVLYLVIIWSLLCHYFVINWMIFIVWPFCNHYLIFSLSDHYFTIILSYIFNFILQHIVNIVQYDAIIWLFTFFVIMLPLFWLFWIVLSLSFHYISIIKLFVVYCHGLIIFRLLWCDLFCQYRAIIWFFIIGAFGDYCYYTIICIMFS